LRFTKPQTAVLPLEVGDLKKKYPRHWGVEVSSGKSGRLGKRIAPDQMRIDKKKKSAF